MKPVQEIIKEFQVDDKWSPQTKLLIVAMTAQLDREDLVQPDPSIAALLKIYFALISAGGNALRSELAELAELIADLPDNSDTELSEDEYAAWEVWLESWRQRAIPGNGANAASQTFPNLRVWLPAKSAPRLGIKKSSRFGQDLTEYSLKEFRASAK